MSWTKETEKQIICGDLKNAFVRDLCYDYPELFNEDGSFIFANEQVPPDQLASNRVWATLKTFIKDKTC